MGPDSPSRGSPARSPKTLRMNWILRDLRVVQSDPVGPRDLLTDLRCSQAQAAAVMLPNLLHNVHHEYDRGRVSEAYRGHPRRPEKRHRSRRTRSTHWQDHRGRLWRQPRDTTPGCLIGPGLREAFRKQQPGSHAVTRLRSSSRTGRRFTHRPARSTSAGQFHIEPMLSTRSGLGLPSRTI
jgi:hypothetical protein